ncbi:siderophore ABC transporter substrate-binding protein [Granulicoccus sp. GXG6511]|uniref:siderophore ABC transporter substrate-binding protein n=1 Tax=Granulicoccus sp. GXG6511 TaxID=3381351 RepID=UPI003D7E186C
MVRRLAALLTVLLLSLTACGQGGQTDRTSAPSGEHITVTHTQGTTELEGSPEKIVVLDFGALDTVKALGLGDKVVGLPKRALPAFLGEFADEKFEDVGTLQEPNLETISKLDPDLVIVGFRSAAKYPELSQHWPTIDITFTSDKNLIDGTAAAAAPIAEAFGKQAEADAKIAALRAKATGLEAKGADAGKGLIVMTSGGKISLHGPKSRYGVVHTLLGVPQARENIAAESHGEPASFELLAEINPEVMFVVDRDAAIGTEGQNARQILDNELVRGTTAWQQNRLVMLDGSRWYITIHGLDNAGAMLDEAAQGLPA